MSIFILKNYLKKKKYNLIYMVNTYNLVNPCIKGQFKSEIKAKNSLEAAKKMYNNMSEHFNNNVPKFFFSIQKGQSGKGKVYHFKVKESKNGEDIDFSIEQYNLKGAQKANKSLLKKLGNFNERFNKQSGGDPKKKKKKGSKKKGSKKKATKKRKSKKDSSESESDSEDYSFTTGKYISTIDHPIYYWWYDPTVYSVDSIFVPTFYSYNTPHIEVDTTYVAV